jgi:protein-tyrosine-phosphatase
VMAAALLKHAHTNQGSDTYTHPHDSPYTTKYDDPLSVPQPHRKNNLCLKIKSAGIQGIMVNGFAVSVMQEIGLDISDHEARTLDDVVLKKYDMIITLTPEAHHVVLTSLGHEPSVKVMFWHMMDPLYNEGSRMQILNGFRELRDQLQIKTAQLLLTIE